MMKHKKYIQPLICVAEIEPATILANSNTLKKATNHDYEEENIRDLRDTNGNIWAD